LRERHYRGLADFLATEEGPILRRRLELSALRADGTEFPIELAITPISAVDPILFTAYVRDITAVKQAEQALRMQREWLQVTLESIGDAVIATDTFGRVTFMNPVAQSLTGWRQGEAAGRLLPEVFHIIGERSRQLVDNPVARVLRDGVVVGLANHTVLITREGIERPVDDSAAPIRDAEGNITGVVLVFRDVTERRQADAALEERARLAAFGAEIGAALTQSLTLRSMLRRAAETTVQHLDAAFARIWTVNEAGDVLELQASAGMYTHLDGFHSRVPMGRFKIGLIAQERRPHLTNAVVGDPRVSDQEWARREGMVAFAGHPLIVEDRLVGVMAMFARHPLTSVELQALASVADELAVGIERKHAEEALRRAHDELKLRVAEVEAASHAKDAFLALLGHELRNPLAPIRNAVKLLALQGNDLTVVAQARDIIGRQAEQMTRLVDELLDASRIAQGKVQLKREQLDLAALVRSATGDNRADLETAGLSLSVEVPTVPVWVHGDAARLTQVVGNLLHNAQKFTDAGGRVRVRLAEEEGQAKLSVEDTGVGIASESLPKLFEVFSQVNATLERSKGGLGLGLSVVKGLVELHGGQVRAASDGPGRGATFTIWVPLDREPHPAPPTQETAPRPEGGRRKVLIIEDGRDAAESLRMLLSLQGFEVAVAHTGPDGVERARRFVPEAVVCDLGLPGMSGFQVAQALRADPATASAFLVCLSGYGQEQDRRQARAAGFDETLVKPADPEALARLLTRPRD